MDVTPKGSMIGATVQGRSPEGETRTDILLHVPGSSSPSGRDVLERVTLFQRDGYSGVTVSLRIRSMDLNGIPLDDQIIEVYRQT